MKSRFKLPKTIRLGWLFAVLYLSMSLIEAESAPIICAFIGTGSGSVGSSTFAEAPFTIQLFGDTDDVFLYGSPYFAIWDLDGSSSVIDIAGIGTAAFTTSKRVFVNQNYAVGGFSQGGVNGDDLLNIQDTSFADYDLTTSFGPVF